MTENKKNSNICPGCGRGCSLDNPHCPRGEEYARTGSFSEGRNHTEVHKEHSHHDHHEPHGHRGHGGHGMRPPHPHDRGHKPPHYESMDNTDKLLHLLGKLHHQSRHHFDGKGTQHNILHMLQKEGSMTQRDITERLGIQPGSASEILKKLETASLIRRSPSENDRRTTNVHLTENGAALAQQKEKERKDRKSELLAALSEEEAHQLLALLEKLSESWDRHAHHGHGPRHE